MAAVGWNRFFSQFSQILRCAERQYGTANEQYSEYIINRLEIAIGNVENLKNRFASAKYVAGDAGTL